MYFVIGRFYLNIMEPKEKAIELIDKFRPYVDSEIAGETNFQFSKEQETSMAKKCALVAVYEILQSNPTIKGTSEDLVTQIVQTKAYWYRVIEALNAP